MASSICGRGPGRGHDHARSNCGTPSGRWRPGVSDRVSRGPAAALDGDRVRDDCGRGPARTLLLVTSDAAVQGERSTSSSARRISPPASQGPARLIPAVPADLYAQTQTDLAREPVVASLATPAAGAPRRPSPTSSNSSTVTADQKTATFSPSNRFVSPTGHRYSALVCVRARLRGCSRRWPDTAALQNARAGVEAELARLQSTGQGLTAFAASLAEKAHEIRDVGGSAERERDRVRSGTRPPRR